MAKRRRKSAKRLHAKKSRIKKSRAARARPRRVQAPNTRAIEATLAGVAHDIRTPLTGVLALAELLASSNLAPRERQWANAVKSGAEHLAALTTLIVDAVKADAAGLVLQKEPFSPRRLAEAVGRAFAARAETKGIPADIAITSDLPAMVAGDALRLRAALENLTDNAVKFTDSGSLGFVASAEPARGERTRLTFAVSDSGIGLSPSEIKKLFRPFAQASEQVARRYGGAGLGLVFVRRIARLMGGDLTVTSKKGHGSTFRFTVLVDRVTVRSDMAYEGDAQSAPARSLAVLCAEDNPYGRVVMNTILTELGHRVDFVESGEAVLEALARMHYDAVLMDVTLAGLDGIEATRRIRALPGNPGKIRIIGITGRTESGSEEAARAAGMDFYFVKPVSPRRLAQALATLNG